MREAESVPTGDIEGSVFRPTGVSRQVGRSFREGGAVIATLRRDYTRRVAAAFSTAGCLSLLAVGAARAATQVGFPEGCGGPIRLHLVSTRALSHDVRPRGLAVGSTGAVVFWNFDSTLVWLPAAGSTPATTSHIGGSIVAAALLPGDTLASVITTNPTQVIEVAMSGRVGAPRRVLVDGDVDVVEGTKAGNGWAFALAEGRGSWSVAVLKHGALVPVFHIARSAEGNAPRQWMRLSSGSAGRVLATQRVWPFDIYDIDLSGSPVARRLSRLKPTAELLASRIQTEWSSLPALALECGTIQTLARRTTDERLIIVRDEIGRVLRMTRMWAPIGFVASEPLSRTLTAVRALESWEIVQYRWTR